MGLIRKRSSDIPKDYTPAERKAITEDVVAFIRQRTDKGIDRNNKSFPKYSKAYMKSNEFKEAGKSSKVNLKLSHDMMSALKALPSNSGSITYGYEKGSPEIGKVDGNVRGTYGQRVSTSKKRDFLGISRGDLSNILKKYPIKDREKSKSRAALINAISELSDKQAKKLAVDMVAEDQITIALANIVLEEQGLDPIG